MFGNIRGMNAPPAARSKIWFTHNNGPAGQTAFFAAAQHYRRQGRGLFAWACAGRGLQGVQRMVACVANFICVPTTPVLPVVLLKSTARAWSTVESSFRSAMAAASGAYDKMGRGCGMLATMQGATQRFGNNATTNIVHLPRPVNSTQMVCMNIPPLSKRMQAPSQMSGEECSCVPARKGRGRQAPALAPALAPAWRHIADSGAGHGSYKGGQGPAELPAASACRRRIRPARVELIAAPAFQGGVLGGKSASTSLADAWAERGGRSRPWTCGNQGDAAAPPKRKGQPLPPPWPTQTVTKTWAVPACILRRFWSVRKPLAPLPSRAVPRRVRPRPLLRLPVEAWEADSAAGHCARQGRQLWAG